MSIRVRLRRLETRIDAPKIYPVCAIYTKDHLLQRICLTDGSQLTGQQAVLRLGAGHPPFPVKTYIGFGQSRPTP
jgi:hypothetical protein